MVGNRVLAQRDQPRGTALSTVSAVRGAHALFLVRGLRTRNRNDFLLSGLFLDWDLHGYSPFRMVPFVVIAAFVLFWLHDQSKGARKDAVIWLALIWRSLPCSYSFRFCATGWIFPAEFGFRAASRLSSVENPITQPIWQIFLSNVWKALKMFNFNDGQIWVHSVTRPPGTGHYFGSPVCVWYCAGAGTLYPQTPLAGPVPASIHPAAVNCLPPCLWRTRGETLR